MLSAARLHELLTYDPATGEFRWRVSKGAAKAGAVAGAKRQGRFYLGIRIDGELHLSHRLAFLYMRGYLPQQYVDHANGDGYDNRWCNLREASQSQNMGNARRHKDNASGFKGVSHSFGKWSAEIMRGGKKHRLGRFNSPQEAAQAYAAAAKQMFGEFARAA